MIISTISKAPVLDGYPDLVRQLVAVKLNNYSKILDSPRFPFKVSLSQFEQGRLFASIQLHKRPWWLLCWPSLSFQSLPLNLYLFSAFNSMHEVPSSVPTKLSDCLFKTCAFSSAMSTPIEDRVKQALGQSYRWFFFELQRDSSGDWSALIQTRDQSIPLDQLITIMVREGFNLTSLPLVIRLATDRYDSLEEELQDLQLDLLQQFPENLIITPGDHHSANVEDLRFKVGL